MTIEQAQKKIRNAWIVGLISGFMTVLFTIAGAANPSGSFEFQGSAFGLWNLLDVFLIFLFTFGIYMKNRVAAIGMVVYFLISKLDQFLARPEIDAFALYGTALGVVLLYFYFEGARGAIAYHRLRRAHTPVNPPVTSPGDG